MKVFEKDPTSLADRSTLLQHLWYNETPGWNHSTPIGTGFQ